ncbi:hypothetical protein BHM03_00045136 [Ensete ventricosum]|nr:hypothetical protein BHM03_00045136 [Ensete ventricosum]
MGVRGFFVGALGMCRLLGTLTGRSKIQAVTSCRSRLLVLSGAVATYSLLRCSRESCLSSDFAEGIEKITINTLGDRQRKTVRLDTENAGGCRFAEVRSLIKLGGHV